MSRHWLHRLVAAVVLGLLVLAVPGSGRPAATVSLVKVETSKAVDFGEDVVWILALGSDARGTTDLLRGRADAIQLIGVDFGARSGVAFGVPRDSWVQLGDGTGRINEALIEGGRELMTEVVAELFGVEADFVLTLGLHDFARLVDQVGGVEVRSPIDLPDIGIRTGRNQLDGSEAAEFARTRHGLPRSDFDRSANHQELLRAILHQVIAREDEVGFVEAGVRAASAALDTNLSPTELYRLAQAVTRLDVSRIRTCVLDGTDAVTSGGGQVIYVDEAQARRLGDDARDDARLDGPCRR